MSKKILSLRHLFGSSVVSASGALRQETFRSRRFNQTRSRDAAGTRRLGMEALENRELLSASPWNDSGAVETSGAAAFVAAPIVVDDVSGACLDLTGLVSAATVDGPEATGEIADVSAANGATIELDLADYFSAGDWNYTVAQTNADSKIFAVPPTIANGKLTATLIGNADYAENLDLSAVGLTVTAASKTDATATAASNEFVVSLANQKTATLQAVFTTTMPMDSPTPYKKTQGFATLGYGADEIPASQTVDFSSYVFLELWTQDNSSAWGVDSSGLQTFMITVRVYNGTLSIPDPSTPCYFGQFSVELNSVGGDGYTDYKATIMYNKSTSSCYGVGSGKILASLYVERDDASQPVVAEIIPNADKRDPSACRLRKGAPEATRIDNSQIVMIGAASSVVAMESVVLSTNAPKVGDAIAATLGPADATADYQWYRVDATGAETAIKGATGATYEVVAADVGAYLKVVATGTLAYSGTVSAQTTSVVAGQAATLTEVSLSKSKPVVGITVEATLGPDGATADYQWYRVDATGTATAIAGATNASYTPTEADFAHYLKVVATGTGDYAGTAEKTTEQTTLLALSGVSLSTDRPRIGVEIVATVAPNNATATYQWKRVDPATGKVAAIEGATNASYTPTAADLGSYVKVVVYGNGDYGSVNEKMALGLVGKARLSGVSLSSDAPRVGVEIVATVAPNDATATYQWKRVDPATGKVATIEGATNASYTPTVDDIGYSIKVVATGTGYYTSAVEKMAARPVAKARLSGVSLSSDAPRVGVEIVATVAPNDATATYQWKRVDPATGKVATIEGATNASYTPTADDIGYSIKVVATGTGNYTSAVEKMAYRTTAPELLSGVLLSTNKPRVGEAIVATLAQEGATATYQWKRVDATGKATTIEGATNASYTPTADDIAYTLKVVAKGTGSYAGTVEKMTYGRVAKAQTSAAVLDLSVWNALADEADDDEEFWAF